MAYIKTPHFHKQAFPARWLSVLALVLILLAACSSPPSPTLPPATATPLSATPEPTEFKEVDVSLLYDTFWVLVAYGDPSNPTIVEQGLKVSLEFSIENQVSGFAGCNNFTGTYEASSDGSLSIGPLATTRMACSQAMDIENAYLSALQNLQSFGFSPEGRLEILYLDSTGIEQKLVYINGKTTLTDNVWVLLSYGDPKSPESVPANNIITAIFTADGYLTGFGGCNEYSTEYTLQDDQLTFGPVASTRMACPAGMDAEQTYLDALSTAQTYEIVGRTLNISYNLDAGELKFTSTNLPLEHTMWTLTAVDGQPLPAETQITAMLTPGDAAGSGIIGGSSGCNSYTTGYTLDGSSITFSPVLTTLMECPTGMEAEQSYLHALETAQSYEVLADHLLLTTESGVYTFIANRTALEGALWSLVAIGDINEPQTPVQGSNFTVQFVRSPDAPSGLLVGTTGCNEYSTAYAASFNEIKINPASSTANQSCVPGLVDQEQAYFLALNNASQYRITGNTLLIPYDDNRQALVFIGTQVNVAQRLPLSDLDNTTWYLWYLNNQSILPGTTVSAKFIINPGGASGSMSGLAGCSNYVAEFGERLGMETYLNGSQVCSKPDGIMDQEKIYLQVLSRTYGYWLSETQLVLNAGQGVLTYRRVRPPESDDQTYLLVGLKWFLISYNESYSLANDKEPFVQFNADGNILGFTGCNDLSGAFQTEITSINIRDLKLSGQACLNPGLSAQEQAMMDILSTAASYQVADTSMQIVGEKGVMNFSLTPRNRPEESESPIAEFTAPSQAMVDEVVTFDGTASTGQVPLVSWNWSFGDDIMGTGPVVSHVYSQPGTYTVNLVVTDQRNSKGSKVQTITVSSPVEPTPEPTPEPTQGPTPTTPPEATQTPTPTQPPDLQPPAAAIQGPSQGYVGEPLRFDATGSQAGSSPISMYAWDFGDGSSAGASPAAVQETIYNHAGIYQVTVLVTDENGLSASATMQVVITTRLDTPFVWVLDELVNEPLLPGTSITLQFKEGEIAGFAGCNSYSGEYSAEQNEDGTYSIQIDQLIITKLACPEAIMKQEQFYFAFLESVDNAWLHENFMDLSYPAGIGPDELPYPEGVIEFHEIGTLRR